jgi:hypothetical protein
MPRPLTVLIIVYTIIAAFTIYYFDGTGDGGDSITHFLFAKYAPVHPELYFDHWAKPFFVLLASPFAQLGFTGIKIFNALLMLGSIIFTVLSARLLNYKYAWIAGLMLIVSPKVYILTFSGLTEPLFAFVLIFSVWLCLRKKNILGAIMISFLPFVRSEGLIICAVFALYFLYRRQYKVVPLLLTGHLIYSVAGYFVYHNLLWVFTAIPYATLKSIYGHGSLFHFLDQMTFVAGIPIYVFFYLGLVWFIYKVAKRQIQSTEVFLVLYPFITFFVAHSLFWYFGIFGSMGLSRVLVGVMPLACLIALNGFNMLTGFFKQTNLRLTIQFVFIAYLIIFPFSKNNTSVDFKRDMALDIPQQKAQILGKYLNKNYPHNRLVSSYPYLFMVTQRDYFDLKARIDPNLQSIKTVVPNDVVVWDPWFCSLSPQEIESTPGLEKKWQLKDREGNKSIFIVYQKIK